MVKEKQITGATPNVAGVGIFSIENITGRSPSLVARMKYGWYTQR